MVKLELEPERLEEIIDALQNINEFCVEAIEFEDYLKNSSILLKMPLKGNVTKLTELIGLLNKTARIKQ